jgi:septum site-determining protein MinC
MTSAAPVRKKTIRFKARSFTAFSLAPERPLDAWLEELDGWLANSPGFFIGRPVVLELGNASGREAVEAVSALGKRGIRVYAIEADTEDFGAGLPPVLKGAKTVAAERSQDLDEAIGRGAAEAPAEPERAKSLMIEQPVRSGQSIVHGGDIIVLGSVGSGSELIAGGSIHVYGALRGRALAGVYGNRQARIFCRRNEAELLSIDGWYQTAEDMDLATRGRAVQVFLRGDDIAVAALE